MLTKERLLCTYVVVCTSGVTNLYSYCHMVPVSAVLVLSSPHQADSAPQNLLFHLLGGNLSFDCESNFSEVNRWQMTQMVQYARWSQTLAVLSFVI